MCCLNVTNVIGLMSSGKLVNFFFLSPYILLTNYFKELQIHLCHDLGFIALNHIKRTFSQHWITGTHQDVQCAGGAVAEQVGFVDRNLPCVVSYQYPESFFGAKFIFPYQAKSG